MATVSFTVDCFGNNQGVINRNLHFAATMNHLSQVQEMLRQGAMLTTKTWV